jgi:ProP effector
MSAKREDIDATVELLCERFPRSFFQFERRRRPLKLGIRQDLEAILGDQVDRKLLGAALKQYTNNLGYRQAHKIVGNPRLDLDGNACGEVSEQHALQGRDAIAGIKARIRRRQRAQDKPAADTEAPRTTVKPEPETAPPPPVSEPPKRASLADLKAAAQRRKAME